MNTFWIGLSLCLIGLCVALALFSFVDWNSAAGIGEAREKMLLEVFKFSITTMFVGGAALVYNAVRESTESARSEREKELEKQKAQAAEQLQRRREEVEKQAEDRSVRRNHLEQFLREFSEAYNDIKFIRRELRRALRSETDHGITMPKDKYVEMMRALNVGQLRLEKFRRLLESRPTYLSALSDEGLHWIADAEDHLRQVTKEYEDNKLSTADEANYLAVASDSKLFQFVVPRSSELHDGTNISNFFGPLDEFFRTLAESIEDREE